MAQVRGLTNSGVVKAWVEGREGHSGNDNFETDGINLFSYSMRIGSKNFEGQPIVLSSQFGRPTVTTGQHMSDATWALGYNGGVRQVTGLIDANAHTSWNKSCNFPLPSDLGRVVELRATTKEWKTKKGAKNAMSKMRDNAEMFVSQVTYSWGKSSTWTIYRLYQIELRDIAAYGHYGRELELPTVETKPE